MVFSLRFAIRAVVACLALFFGGVEMSHAADDESLNRLMARCLTAQQDSRPCLDWMRASVLAPFCAAGQTNVPPSLSFTWAMGKLGPDEESGLPCSLAPDPIHGTSRTDREGAQQVLKKLRALSGRLLNSDELLLYDLLLQLRFPQNSDHSDNFTRGLLHAAGITLWEQLRDEPIRANLLLIRAQLAYRRGDFDLSKRVATDVIDLFPLRRQAISARLILSRCLGQQGALRNALLECRQVERTGFAAEAKEANALALQIANRSAYARHRTLALTQDKGYRGFLIPGKQKVLDLAAGYNGTVAAASKSGVALCSESQHKCRLLAMESRAQAFAVAFEDSGALQAVLNDSSHTLVRYLPFPETSTGAPRLDPSFGRGHSETFKAAQRARAIRVDGSGHSWITDRRGRSLLFPAGSLSETVTSTSLPAQVLHENLRALLPLRGGTVLGVLEKPKDRIYLASTQTPSSGFNLKLPPQPAIRKILAADIDDFGWVYLLARTRDSDLLIVMDPAGRSDSPVALKTVETSAFLTLAVDPFGLIYLGTENGNILRYKMGIE